MIMKCTCEHAYQDRVHGDKMRVQNPVTGREKTFRCTVCTKENSKGQSLLKRGK